MKNLDFYRLIFSGRYCRRIVKRTESFQVLCVKTLSCAAAQTRSI